MAGRNQPQIGRLLTVMRADDYLSYVRASGFQLSGGLCLVGPTGRFGFDVRQARSTAAGGHTCAFWLSGSGSGARSGQWLFLFPGLEWRCFYSWARPTRRTWPFTKWRQIVSYCSSFWAN